MAIYEKYRGAIHRFAYQMSGSGAIADEVTQEVFMALIRAPRRFDARRGSLESFLHGIGRKHVLKILQRDRRYVADEEDSPMDDRASEDPDALEALLRNQEQGRLRQGVLALPAAYREALILCDLEELSYEEAARRMDCAVGTVRSRLHRARTMLAAKLGAGRAKRTFSV